VYKLILATKHDELQRDHDAKLMVDIDLSILGQPRDVFDQYEVNIRKEYAHVPDEQFRLGRKNILQSFLDRESIFATDFFKEKYESKAIENLTRSIQQLSR